MAFVLSGLISLRIHYWYLNTILWSPLPVHTVAFPGCWTKPLFQSCVLQHLWKERLLIGWKNPIFNSERDWNWAPRVFRISRSLDVQFNFQLLSVGLVVAGQLEGTVWRQYPCYHPCGNNNICLLVHLMLVLSLAQVIAWKFAFVTNIAEIVWR